MAMHGQEDIGIYFNADVNTFMDTLENSDKTTFLYVTTSDLSTSEQDWTMLDYMFRNKIGDLGKEYMNTFAYDCQHPSTQDLQGKVLNQDPCTIEPFQPFFKLFVPPDIRTNPYTGKRMPTAGVSYTENDGHISEPAIKKWFTNNLPNYSSSL